MRKFQLRHRNTRGIMLHRRGFTLVEMIIVIVVIGILAAVIIVAYNGVTQKAIEASMRVDLNNARNSIALLKAGHKNYPSDVSGANNGQGLKASGANQLVYGGSGSNYCVQATNAQTSTKLSLLNGVIQNGSCHLVSTFAGNNVGTYWVDTDGTGAAATFNWPASIATDSSGNFYITDCGSTVRKMTPTGVVTTFAGTDQQSALTDGTGSAARFNCPEGVAVDPSNNVYVADASNHAIRKITPAGVVTTIAGSTTPGYLDGTGSAAQFGSPEGITVGRDGNIYVADSYYTWNCSVSPCVRTDYFHGIRKVTPSGIVTTFAGNTTAGSANGTGTAAQFNMPHGIVTDSTGNFFVADSNNNIIRKVTTGGVVTTLAGSGTAGTADGTGTAAQFNWPTALAIDKTGNLYTFDGNTYIIRKITSSGVVTTLAGSAGNSGYVDGPGTTAQFMWVENGLTVGADGALYMTDSSNYVIRKLLI